ncbi:nudix-type nucleoside diphosphatase, YffH/AdpP family [Mesorhizobium australicum]|uniref:GDP-mannose pyrophosphatase n=2 Tax=Mesorhizobium australicum TaxID=536018 RepID=A0A1X7PQ53_9HYPH|nr:nudix-type nucleoside diphosphatase, YffH/AdpP family [Mesorhizobium australicum]
MSARPQPTSMSHFPPEDLTGVRVRDVTLLSDNWYFLSRYAFDLRLADGTWQSQLREAYDRGNGATILLYNRERGTVVLTRQFRLPAFLNGGAGWMIETAAGLLDGDDPGAAIRREVAEETGYRIGEAREVFDIFMSPGSVTERLHFFIAEFDPADRPTAGGGAEGENENIEVLEIAFDEALAMVARNEIRDAKTILLLYHARIHGIL